MSLRVRLMAALGALLLLAFGAGHALVAGAVLGPLVRQLGEERARLAVALARAAEADPAEAGPAVQAEAADWGVEARILADPGPPPPHRPRPRELRVDGRAVRVARGPRAPVDVPLAGPGLDGAVLRVWFPTDLDGPPRAVGLGLLALLGLATAGAFGLVHWSLRPLDVARDAMRRAADGDLAHRAPEGPDAAGQIAALFNRMTARVQALLDDHRARTAGISHELRTPLTRLRLQTELLREALEGAPLAERGAVQRRLDGIDAEADALARLTEELVEHSRLELGADGLLRQPTDFGPVAAAAVEAALGSRTEHRVEVDVPAGLVLDADPVRLRRAMDNLLGNVVRHTPPGTVATVRARAGAAGMASITVEDDGPGVPEAELPSLLQPFRRGERARAETPGLGLGLHLVAQIVAAHRGRLSVDARPGGGLRVVLAWPLAG